MGYTTRFEGVFKFSRVLTVLEYTSFTSEIERYSNMQGPELEKAGVPRSYCQWQITQDGTGLEWDGGEKFYLYDEEWLKYIVERFNKVGLKLLGCVLYQGESVDDCGMLTVQNNQNVLKQPYPKETKIQDRFDALKPRAQEKLLNLLGDLEAHG